MGMLASGELLVVETEDDLFLGGVELVGATLIVRNGFVGRPKVLLPEEVLRVVPATEYLEAE